MECAKCGACCVAPDISALDKPLGLRCAHLGPDCLCQRYEERPDACRNYRPDELCRAIAAPSLDERVSRYLALFGLTDQAEALRAEGFTSMAAWQRRHRP